MKSSETVAGDPVQAGGSEAAFGTWASPITAESVAAKRLRISFPVVSDDQVWWQEVRPNEEGRTTIVHRAADGRRRDLLPPPWNARTRVHEYGGLSYLPVPRRSQDGDGWALVFANFADQRLYMTEGAAPPRPLTPQPAAPSALRYADFALSADGTEIWCVRERHDDGKITRSIVAVPLEGSATSDPGAIRELVSGADFFAYPTPSPDGRHLAWVSWNHPQMPWDGSELRVAPVTGGRPGPARVLMGSETESVLAPLWRDNASLYVISDRDDWWNLYHVSIHGTPPRAVCPTKEDFAYPLWTLGGRPFGMLADGRIAVLHGRADLRLGVIDPDQGQLHDPDLPYSTYVATLSCDGMTIGAVGASHDTPQSLIRVNVVTSRVEVLKRELEEILDAAYFPAPRKAELAGPDGRTVYALIFPPCNPAHSPPAGELPPYIAWVHGGPTDRAPAKLDLERAYFTSRGIGVIEVNYGGSCGYGRAYRERLRHQWGVVDVQDSMAAVLSLVDAGEADGARLGIRGSSAGGWTALAAVTTGTAYGRVFGAAASYYGVTDLERFAATTHDFESRYLDGLVGPLPEAEEVYRERSPVGHITAGTCPILLLQGVDDPVVPCQQAQTIAAELSAQGIPHALLLFEGESHGFRKAETLKTSLEAEISFYGQIFGFQPPGVPRVQLTPEPG
ncbi:MAG TPA: prolyl oligopeptidase family serine peptidase [Streptosporangiaceae bacterium]|nr:prolyl oligopeptidase family serine peptidase [Streptosporangiaceae bacterium]